MYNVVHDMRTRIGELLHDIHEFLTTKQEDDVSCFTSLYIAYRTWFIDVGLERSAHTLDRVTRLLASDMHLYKVSGLRKDYPRPLLVRRAHVYHLQRLRHNSSPRPRSDLDNQLLLDLAASSTSLYTEIRKNAQTAGESAVKVLLGARGLVIPPLLKAFREAVPANDYPRIKGGIFSLLFGSLSKTLRRDWKHAPAFIRAFIEASTVDKPSIQKLVASTTFQVMEWGRPLSRMAIVDAATIKALAPSELVDDATLEKIEQKRALVQRKRTDTETRMAKFALELVELSNTGHWKLASRAGAMVISLGLRFDTIAPASLIVQLAQGTIDPHPALRGLYSGGLVAVCISHTTVDEY